MSRSTQTDPVLEALEFLAATYLDRTRSRHRSNTCEENGELAEYDLDEAKKLLDELRSSLLPLIKHELKTLSTALDPPHDSREYPSPDIKLTLQTLSNLDLTMQKSLHYINSSPLKAFYPTDAYDHHFKQCKAFRCYNLAEAISFLEMNLRSLFLAYIKLIKSRNLPIKHPEEPRYRAPTPREETVECLKSIDQAIRWSQASDFALLQLKWRGVVERFHDLLARLAKLIDQISRHARINTILRKHIVEQARLIVPVIKLLRNLYDKISNTTKKKLLFTLDLEVNSDTLHTLKVDSGVILCACDMYVQSLELCHMHGSMVDTSEARRVRNKRLSRSVESTLVLLALYIIPLSPKVDHSSLESDFKAWLSQWHVLWRVAKERVLDAMHVHGEEN
ncbi:hypothetical protein PGT21_032492 [Puccinia graminis f. sp. tritici]|uniref:Uncharacterized protein n=1 Tax=Puccinia graminis f. sp. tritici TaxID=56615 RepID=A0A5B0NPY3_PUCGR|nr:hypothetical protein PGTUg99_032670 [Puccinia graminis f. sp. tritici]KAA1091347.1 hypothetical protein PGT21_031767 [Puccinia graminis f. sp. tritici]KAA1110828.1 hypothetical protein PGT21_032492 [Puccinia graminis f. sp. tritici]